MGIRMIVTDLDGTLLREDKTVSAYTKSIIKACREKGIRFSAATARPKEWVMQFLQGIPCDGAVYHNGGHVEYEGRKKLFGITPAETRQVVQALLAENPDEQITVEMETERYANFDITALWDIGYNPSDFSDLPLADALKILVRVQPEEQERYRNLLPENLYMQMSESTLGMIMNRDARKITGIRAICGIHGIGLSEVAAFGDDLNDMEMLRACGTGVAVGNALEEVKAAADAVCGTNEQDGIAKWLEIHVL